MSHLLGVGRSPWTGLDVPDERARARQDQWWMNNGICAMPFTQGVLWSVPELIGDDDAAPSLVILDDIEHSENAAFDSGGGQQRLKIRGMTYDSTGTPLGSATIDAFVTATGVKVGTCVSDAGGYYECPTPMVGTQHYVVAYRSGSPDVGGVSVNTITPS